MEMQQASPTVHQLTVAEIKDKEAIEVAAALHKKGVTTTSFTLTVEATKLFSKRKDELSFMDWVGRHLAKLLDEQSVVSV
jgi:hypothetical protein